jgi:hypothetical protein
MYRNHVIVIVLAAVAGLIYTATLQQPPPGQDQPMVDAAERFEAGILHDDGWAIVPREVDGDREIWFIAPDRGDATPAVFKKKIHVDASSRQTTIVSECEAPKAVCDSLQAKFEELSARHP